VLVVGHAISKESFCLAYSWPHDYWPVRVTGASSSQALMSIVQHREYLQGAEKLRAGPRFGR